ncbi:hypothetical protein F5148DRAFT_482270 [Russula earlei]|uniref:Uncharacterized protein n=1 Tax=Russula earlei TaxID=71964 RepID=A0ACC0TZ57_9AGAM|nr:hypothetical protein F5148DRAFT_482270 [Russula earlei]
MELMSVAQKYKMNVVLIHIRNHIAQQDPPFIREETAFLIYALAQKYGLRAEALQAARCTLSFSTLTIRDLHKEGRLIMMPGDALHELWTYHKRVRSNLMRDIEVFRTSNAKVILGDSSCASLTDLGIPSWIDGYVNSIGTTPVPAFVDLTEFHMELAKHICGQSQGGNQCTSCADIPSGTIRAFWGALTTVVNGSIAKVDSDFALAIEIPRSEYQPGSPGFSPSPSPSPRKYLDMSNADVILQSSSFINFKVHKSVLATSSPFFRDMFSLPQPSSDELVDGLPVVHLSEDEVVLNSLISMLYPVHPEMPYSVDNILSLLAAAEKYDMTAVQSSIRAEISGNALLTHTPKAFRMYAIACNKGLIPEMKSAARLTLDYPLTFEKLGNALRSFEHWALSDLADFHQECKATFSAHLMSFLDKSNPYSQLWVGCSAVRTRWQPENDDLPPWLENLIRQYLTQDTLTLAIPKSSKLGTMYLGALQAHVNEMDCHNCMKVHVLRGEQFLVQINWGLALARNVRGRIGMRSSFSETPPPRGLELHHLMESPAVS